MKYYNGARTHLSLEKDAPVSRAVDRVGHISWEDCITNVAGLIYDRHRGHSSSFRRVAETASQESKSGAGVDQPLRDFIMSLYRTRSRYRECVRTDDLFYRSFYLDTLDRTTRECGVLIRAGVCPRQRIKCDELFFAVCR
jgi:hypothetical protein